MEAAGRFGNECFGDMKWVEIGCLRAEKWVKEGAEGASTESSSLEVFKTKAAASHSEDKL